MTVSSIEPVNNYKGNGSTQKFDFDFYIEDETQLEVYLTDRNGVQSKLTCNTDYTIHELKNKNGSYITYPASGSSHGVLTADETISLVLALPIVQDKEYENSGALHLDTLEYSLDYLTLLVQILSRQISRALKIQEGLDIDMDKLSSSLVIAANNAENINTAAENIQNINAAGSSISSINAVCDDLENVDFLAENIDYVHNVQIWTEGTDDEVQAIGGEHSAKGWAEFSTNANVSLANLNAAGGKKLREVLEIGAPIASLSNTLNDDEIWLEGASVSKTAYAELYAVYGDRYGSTSTHFTLPNLINKVLWGAPDSSNIGGYLGAALPNIFGSIDNVVCLSGNSAPLRDGALFVSNFVYNNGFGTTAGGGNGKMSISINAKSYNSIYSDYNIVRPSSIAVRWKTRYK